MAISNDAQSTKVKSDNIQDYLKEMFEQAPTANTPSFNHFLQTVRGLSLDMFSPIAKETMALIMEMTVYTREMQRLEMSQMAPQEGTPEADKMPSEEEMLHDYVDKNAPAQVEQTLANMERHVQIIKERMANRPEHIDD